MTTNRFLPTSIRDDFFVFAERARELYIVPTVEQQSRYLVVYFYVFFHLLNSSCNTNTNTN